ncbi:hypothetical protein BCR34DRAFT_588267 [Clohesyomyces aquaticus]|uniref:Uncharacterized protein n=1 Tax=Clohesyomyces aquaticus TaxID=1231657 RepID=A0A1Y1ZL70_9PLEO|nr:hypothetical protein BCR34DRAFT_588267 [Clohesyomyces aquaticus]
MHMAISYTRLHAQTRHLFTALLGQTSRARTNPSEQIDSIAEDNPPPVGTFRFTREVSSDHCWNLTALPGKVTSADYAEANGRLESKGHGGRDWLDCFTSGRSVVQEVIGWEAFVWAVLQTAVSDYAIGSAVREPSARAYMKNNTTKGEKELCQVQRVRMAGGFVTVNTFGLALIAVFSILSATIDFMLPRFSITLSKFRRAMAPKLDRGIRDGVFQLQRRAYEVEGRGSWQHIEKEKPVTTGNERLEDLPIASVSGSNEI